MSNHVIMFPGLGAEYPGMMAQFCDQFPEAADTVARWSRQLGCDLMAEAPAPAPAPASASARERQRHRQLQIHALNLLWWRRVGPSYPDAAVCGHSLGYYAALVAAGVIDEEFSLRLLDTVFRVSWDAWAGNTRQVGVVTAHRVLDPRWLLEAHRLETLCINSDHQFAVYGAAEDCAALCAGLGDDLIGWSRLDTPVPFHSWAMGGVSATLQRLMRRDRWQFEEPRRLLWSHIHGYCVPDGEAAAAVLTEQPRLTVQWRETIRAMQSRRVCHFVEVGPNRILSQMVRRIDPHLSVATSDRLRSARKLAA